MIMARFMRAPVEGVHDVLTSPGWRGELDRRAAVLVELQQTMGRVANISQR